MDTHWPYYETDGDFSKAILLAAAHRAAAREGLLEICTLREVCTHTGAKPEALADEGSLPHGWYKPGSRLVMICNTAVGKCAAGVGRVQSQAGLCRAGMMLNTGLNALSLRGAHGQGDGVVLPQSPSEAAGAGKRTQCPDPSAAPSPQGYSPFQQLL